MGVIDGGQMHRLAWAFAVRLCDKYPFRKDRPIKLFHEWHINNVKCIFSDNVKAVSMSGKMKSSKRQAAELHFDFPVESLGKFVV